MRKLISGIYGSALLQELSRAAFHSMIYRMLGIGTGFLITIMMARWFGADGVGTVAICTAILNIAGNFGRLGFDGAAMRLLAEKNSTPQQHEIRSIYRLSSKVLFISGCIITVILFFSSGILAKNILGKPYLERILQYNSLMVLPIIFLIFHAECMRGLKQIKSYTFFTTAAISTFCCFILPIAYRFSNSNEVPVYVQFIAIILSAALSFFVWKNISSNKLEYSKTVFELKSIIALAKPMLGTLILQMVIAWMGLLMLGSLFTEREAGIYSAIAKVATITNLSVLVINSISMPKLTEAFVKNDTASMQTILRFSVRVICLLSVPVICILLFFPKFIFNLFGSDFEGFDSSLYIMVGAQIFVAITGLPAQLLNATDKQNVLRNITLFATIINVALCLAFIPKYSIAGAALATAASQLFVNMASAIAAYKFFGLKTWLH